MEQDLKELTEFARQLSSLMKDPQPGLMTWMTMLGITLQDICELSVRIRAFKPKEVK